MTTVRMPAAHLSLPPTHPSLPAVLTAHTKEG
jgi:hypothetical protein